ncbi:MAG: methyltransferase domain-containing protein [Desulfuromonadaceae bacterium]|nr:methyltransferase domain-containing protein [Desulfuromonadaceae bacterium]
MPEVSRIAAAFHHSADEYDHHILVQKRVVANLADAIALHLNQQPEHILDVGTGTGALLERLKAHYNSASLTGIDVAHNMCVRAAQKLGASCRVAVGNAECLPFRNDSFDLAVSASALQWVNNLAAALHEMNRVVRPGGDISLAFFCEGTLGELHSCFRDAVEGLCGDSGQRVSRLHDFHTVEEVKTIAGKINFEKIVITVETEVDWYENLHALLRSIKNIGAGSVSKGAGNGLGWRGILQETSRLYQARYGEKNQIPATYKVLYMSAQKKMRTSG